MAGGLRAAAAVYLVMEIVRVLCMREGVADAHFRMRAEARRLVRRHLTWLMLSVVPLVFVHGAMQWQGTEAWQDSLGRLALIAGLMALCVFGLIKRMRLESPYNTRFADDDWDGEACVIQVWT